jgi:ATP-dependent RNA helicase RhlE
LDIATISHVINYDIPETADTYIHRIGRTGRAERDGDALTLVTGEDTATIRDIERALNARIERRTVAGFDYNAPAPVANEFQRAPMPPRGARPNTPRPAAQRGAPQRPAQQGSSNARNRVQREPRAASSR